MIFGTGRSERSFAVENDDVPGERMHVIFLIHGMGNSDSGWSENARKLITDHYDQSRYGFLDQAWPFGKHFKFHEINYNDLFDDYLEEATRQAGKLSQWSRLANPGDGGMLRVLGRIVDLAKKPANKTNFAVTHLADVILFMATDLGELVRNRIAEQIANRLTSGGFNPGSDDWSIVAHALGTRVTTEVLQIGFSDDPGFESFGKARVVMMVSNTSRLLQDLSPFKAGDVYRNRVYPGRKTAGVCHHYINANHRLDPIAFIKEFDPPATFGNGRAFIDEAYHGIKLNAADLTSKEVYSLEHYLEHPEVHTTLFRYLLPPGSRKGPSQAELKDALAEYREKTVAADITNGWRQSLARLKDLPFQSVGQIFDLWEKYGALLK